MDEATLAAVLAEGRVFDLAVEYFPGMPHLPRHIPYAFSVVRSHGDVLMPEGVSASADLFLCGTHTGTHLDALGHYSRDARLHGGVEAAAVQTRTAGLAARGIEEAGVPGVTLEGARWLSAQGIALAGGDTFAFERIPTPNFPVHCHFLVERGIFLLEVADLEALGAAGATTFLLAVLPLKLKGATGSPVRPVAIL